MERSEGIATQLGKAAMWPFAQRSHYVQTGGAVAGRNDSTDKPQATPEEDEDDFDTYFNKLRQEMSADSRFRLLPEERSPTQGIATQLGKAAALLEKTSASGFAAAGSGGMTPAKPPAAGSFAAAGMPRPMQPASPQPQFSRAAPQQQISQNMPRAMPQAPAAPQQNTMMQKAPAAPPASQPSVLNKAMRTGLGDIMRQSPLGQQRGGQMQPL